MEHSGLLEYGNTSAHLASLKHPGICRIRQWQLSIAWKLTILISILSTSVPSPTLSSLNIGENIGDTARASGMTKNVSACSTREISFTGASLVARWNRYPLQQPVTGPLKWYMRVVAS